MRPLSLQYKGGKGTLKGFPIYQIGKFIHWMGGIEHGGQVPNIDTWWVLDGDLYIVDLQDFTMQRYKNL